MTSPTKPKSQEFFTPPHNPIQRGDVATSAKVNVSAASSRAFDSPEKYYSFDASLNILLTPGADQHVRGLRKIYKIKHRITGEAKVGMTAQLFRKRMQQHADCARHPNSDRGQGAFYKALGRSPEKFQAGVVVTLDDEDDPGTLGELETAVIEDHGTLENGYNKVRGGGGGTISEQVLDDGELPPDSFQTPKKGYSVKYRDPKRKKRLFVATTPKGAKTTHVVYGFRRDDGKWLIGETTQRFQDRMYSYHHAFNHPERDVGKRPLPKAVRAEPWRWKVYVLYHGPRIKQMERLWIKAKNAIEDGFNQLGGGGGPTGKAYKESSAM